MPTMLKILLSALLAAGLTTLPQSPTPAAGQPRPANAMPTLPKITPFLWFDTDAEAAIRFYGGIFPDFALLEQTRWGEGAPLPKGTLMTARFRLAGQEFLALNGGPAHRFSEAISLFVRCETQAEIDDLWQKLTAGGGAPGQCGWLKDRFGLSWQVVPTQLAAWLGDPDPAKAARVGQAMLPMRKLDLAALQRAHAGAPAGGR